MRERLKEILENTEFTPVNREIKSVFSERSHFTNRISKI